MDPVSLNTLYPIREASHATEEHLSKLPDELPLAIFRYLPVAHGMYLVSKKFSILSLNELFRKINAMEVSYEELRLNSAEKSILFLTKNNEKITTFNFLLTYLTNTQLHEICTKFPTLRHLHFRAYGRKITDSTIDIQKILNLKNLKSLQIHDYDLNDDEIMTLCQLQQIENLHVKAEDIRPWKILSEIASLKYLSITLMVYGMMLSAQKIEALSSNKIVDVALELRYLGSDGFESLKQINSLHSILFKLVDVDVTKLSELTSLKHLMFRETNFIVDKELNGLKKLSHLQSLLFEDTSTRKGWAAISTLTQLKDLTFNDCTHVTLEKIEALGKNLTNTRIHFTERD